MWEGRASDAYVYTAQAAAEGMGRAGSITISISVDQGEAPSNPGLSPGSHTPQLGLIPPPPFNQQNNREYWCVRNVFVCIYVWVCVCVCGVAVGGN